MGGTRGRNRLTRLRPDCRVTRVGMNNTANGRECLIQQSVRWGVGRGLLLAFDYFTRGDTDYHHIVCGHYAVIDPGRFNHKHVALAIDGADVPPGQGDQIVLRQRQIGFQYLTFKIF